MNHYTFVLLLCLLHVQISSTAQISTNESTGGTVNTITTAVPLLSLNKTAISGGIGEIGVVSSAYHHEPGLYHNPALLSRNRINNSIHVTYIPWLRALVPNLNDFNVSACYSWDSVNTIGLTIDYFDFGQTVFTNIVGNVSGVSHPREYYIDLRYARTINKYLSLGIGIKHFVSDFGIIYYVTPNPNAIQTRAVNSYAVDFGLDYRFELKLGSEVTLRMGNGLSLNNIGPKVSYVSSGYDAFDFIPTTINVGSIITLSNNGLDHGKSITLEFDMAYQASKLLVPSPPIYALDSASNTYIITKGVDSRDFTLLEGMLSSFSDAPNGKQEEKQEIIHQIGLEYRVIGDNFIAALRAGLFLEHELKGARRYTTFGAGLQWREYSIDVSYDLPLAVRHPLQHQWRFSSGYHF